MSAKTKFAVAATATMSLFSATALAGEGGDHNPPPPPSSLNQGQGQDQGQGQQQGQGQDQGQKQSAAAAAAAKAAADAQAVAQGGKGVGIGKGGAGGTGGQGGSGGNAAGGNAAGGNASAQGGTSGASSGLNEHIGGALGISLPPPISVPATVAATTWQTGKCSGQISFGEGAKGVDLTLASWEKAGDSMLVAASDGVKVTYEILDKNKNVVKDKDGNPVTVTVDTETCAQLNRNQEKIITTIQSKQHVAEAALAAAKLDNATCRMAAFTVAGVFDDDLAILGSSGYKELAADCKTQTNIIVKYKYIHQQAPKDICVPKNEKVCERSDVNLKGAAANPGPSGPR